MLLGQRIAVRRFAFSGCATCITTTCRVPSHSDGLATMTKRKQTTFELYDHNVASTIHRSLSVSEDNRRFLSKSNYVNATAASQPSRAPYIPDFQVTDENAPYANDDKHIPVNSENPEEVSGVKVKVKERAKRYQNSVSDLFNMRIRYILTCLRMNL